MRGKSVYELQHEMVAKASELAEHKFEIYSKNSSEDLADEAFRAEKKRISKETAILKQLVKLASHDEL
eukprot:scaffold7849_cov23-Prasinocladus_malaysianus.AAC.3